MKQLSQEEYIDKLYYQFLRKLRIEYPLLTSPLDSNLEANIKNFLRKNNVKKHRTAFALCKEYNEDFEFSNAIVLNRSFDLKLKFEENTWKNKYDYVVKFLVVPKL